MNNGMHSPVSKDIAELYNIYHRRQINGFSACDPAYERQNFKVKFGPKMSIN